MEKLKGIILSNIFRIRTQKGKTQSEVAQGIGVSRSHYCKIESGQIDLRAVALMKLAAYYRICADYFMSEGADWEDNLASSQKKIMELQEENRQLKATNELYGKWNYRLEMLLREKELMLARFGTGG